MSIKEVMQKVFDEAAIELAREGMIKVTNYGVKNCDELIPIKINVSNDNLSQTLLASELVKIGADGWLTIGIGAMAVSNPKSTDKKTKKTKKKETKETKVKKTTKKKKNVEEKLPLPQPVISLVAIHRTKTGMTNILYSKLLQDPRGIFYPSIEENWLEKQELIESYE